MGNDRRRHGNRKPLDRRTCYHEHPRRPGKAQLTENINATLPYMDADMRELAKRALSKVDALTEEEFAELAIYAAEEV